MVTWHGCHGNTAVMVTRLSWWHGCHGNTAVMVTYLLCVMFEFTVTMAIVVGQSYQGLVTALHFTAGLTKNWSNTMVIQLNPPPSSYSVLACNGLIWMTYKFRLTDCKTDITSRDQHFNSWQSRKDIFKTICMITICCTFKWQLFLYKMKFAES